MTSSSRPDPRTSQRAADEPPPFWARWSRIYLFVFALLVAQVVVFSLLSRWAS